MRTERKFPAAVMEMEQRPTMEKMYGNLRDREGKKRKKSKLMKKE